MSSMQKFTSGSPSNNSSDIVGGAEAQSQDTQQSLHRCKRHPNSSTGSGAYLLAPPLPARPAVPLVLNRVAPGTNYEVLGPSQAARSVRRLIFILCFTTCVTIDLITTLLMTSAPSTSILLSELLEDVTGECNGAAEVIRTNVGNARAGELLADELLR
eukprot:CAMPEP_0179059104 /NCGR_PEP_ID=MMETSP0796-20121207/25186_1 /TAXON_ID=73915 /ORGANISM="Pyrodinium bahamense, Strain pbaha01" /LENGTH=157 /DNA_ID=CAMNT_0020755861 /DNA_START=1185 /DNA_END=1660 /DNA_ORIENTATION=+